MAMSEHDRIRELLPLAAADALTRAEEEQVAQHVRSCIACSNQLDACRLIARQLRRLPAPQPSSWVVQATLLRAEAKLTQQDEHDWDLRVLIAVVAFAWLLTIANWPVFHFVSGRFGSLLAAQFPHTPFSHTLFSQTLFSQTLFSQTLFSQTWTSFAVFTLLGWLAAGVAAGLLASRQRRERRLA
jgi:hypothetical protein